MGVPRPRVMADLKKAFAVATACTVRTARRHADANSPEWQRFVATYGVHAAAKVHDGRPVAAPEAVAVQMISAAPPVALPPEVAGRPDEELSQPELMLKQHWLIYQQASEAWSRAMTAGDAMGAMAFGQATIKAQEALYKAQRRLEEWQIAERKVVPFAEFQAMQPLMSAIFNLVRGFPAEIALAGNPQQPQLARQAGEEWLSSRFQPQANALVDKFEQLLPAA